MQREFASNAPLNSLKVRISAENNKIAIVSISYFSLLEQTISHQQAKRDENFIAQAFKHNNQAI
jgi:hypothetical protein